MVNAVHAITIAAHETKSPNFVGNPCLARHVALAMLEVVGAARLLHSWDFGLPADRNNSLLVVAAVAKGHCILG